MKNKLSPIQKDIADHISSEEIKNILAHAEIQFGEFAEEYLEDCKILGQAEEDINLEELVDFAIYSINPSTEEFLYIAEKLYEERDNGNLWIEYLVEQKIMQENLSIYDIDFSMLLNEATDDGFVIIQSVNKDSNVTLLGLV